MTSQLFGSLGPIKPHLVQGPGGLAAEINKLRQDAEEGFSAAELQSGFKTPAQANIRLNTNPTALDTITTGGIIYTFRAALTSPVAPNVDVLIGISAAASLANIISAINGAAAVVPAVYAGRNTVKVKASIYNTDFLHIEPTSDVPGGTVLYGTSPSVALSDGLTAVIAWDHLNLSNTGYAGTLKRMLFKVTVDATNLAADFDVVVPFVPYKATCVLVTDAANVPDATGKAASILMTVVQARSAVTVDFNTGATDPIATDICYFEVLGV